MPNRMPKLVGYVLFVLAPPHLAIACETPSFLPTLPQCHRAMPTRVRNVATHAHLASPLSRHALLACETSPHMPISHHRYRAMLSRVRDVHLNDAGSPTTPCWARTFPPWRIWACSKGFCGPCGCSLE